MERPSWKSSTTSFVFGSLRLAALLGASFERVALGYGLPNGPALSFSTRIRSWSRPIPTSSLVSISRSFQRRRSSRGSLRRDRTSRLARQGAGEAGRECQALEAAGRVEVAGARFVDHAEEAVLAGGRVRQQAVEFAPF